MPGSTAAPLTGMLRLVFAGGLLFGLTGCDGAANRRAPIRLLELLGESEVE